MIEIHVNYPSAEEAASAARAVVERRLAASANIHAPIRSIYWWDGAVRSGDEVPVVFKTSEGAVDRLVAHLSGAHGYKTPSIVIHRPAGAHTSYLAWIERETRQTGAHD